MRSAQVLIVSALIGLSVLNWLKPGFEQYLLIGELPKLSVLNRLTPGKNAVTEVSE